MNSQIILVFQNANSNSTDFEKKRRFDLTCIGNVVMECTVLGRCRHTDGRKIKHNSCVTRES